MVTIESIKTFLEQKQIAVAGASRDPKKFGYILIKELKKKGYRVYPVNPYAEQIEGETCYPSLEALPPGINTVVITTPGKTTVQLVKDAINQNFQNIWIQQGAEDEKAIQMANEANVNLIHNQCLLMYAEPVKSIHALHRFFYKLFGIFPKSAANGKAAAKP